MSEIYRRNLSKFLKNLGSFSSQTLCELDELLFYLKNGSKGGLKLKKCFLKSLVWCFFNLFVVFFRCVKNQSFWLFWTLRTIARYAALLWMIVRGENLTFFFRKKHTSKKWFFINSVVVVTNIIFFIIIFWGELLKPFLCLSTYVGGCITMLLSFNLRKKRSLWRIFSIKILELFRDPKEV